MPLSRGCLRFPCLQTVPYPGGGGEFGEGLIDKPHPPPRVLTWLQFPHPSTHPRRKAPNHWSTQKGILWREMPLHLGLVWTLHSSPSPHSNGGHCWALRKRAFPPRTDLRKVCLALRGVLFWFGFWGVQDRDWEGLAFCFFLLFQFIHKLFQIDRK